MLQNSKSATNSGVEDGSSTSGSGGKTYSVFNTTDYNNAVFGTDKSSKDKSETKNKFIRISKLMKLRQVNASSTLSSVVLKNVLSADGDVNVKADASVEPSISKVRYCSACKTAFDNQTDQRQHYKLDWHRYNIKLTIKQKQSVTEERFTQIMDEKNDKANNDDDDVSSISGSESDTSSESDEEEDVKGAQKIASATALVGNKTKVIFENKNGNIVTFYKSLFSINKTKVNDCATIDDTDTEELTESDYINTASQLPEILSSSKWLIIMIGGGHFAAAVFRGSEPILHKTFHCYTVRAKQGGSQSMKDNKRATAAKSAGASLRRYNEQSLLQHVQDILSSWSNDLTDCQLLFYRAVGPSNRSILFGGKQPPLDRNDPRLSTIPFQTRRATYSEVKRVYSLLASVYVYENEEAFKNTFQLNKQQQNLSSGSNVSPKKNKTEENKTNRASKLRQSPTRENDDEEITNIANRMKLESSSSDQATEYCSTANENMSFSESLEEFGNSPVPIKGKLRGTVANISNENSTKSYKLNKKKKKKKTVKSIINSSNPAIRKFAEKVFNACVDGDFNALENIVKEFKGSYDNNQSVKNEESTEVGETHIESQNGDVDKKYENIVPVFNQETQDGITLLMNAAKNSHKEIIRLLLENGSDPCIRDKKATTAYDFASDKDTRNVFRRFMGEFPDKYDYSKSRIPSPLTDLIEKEMADKKRAMKKKKRLKDKERRIADEPRRQEEAEQKRFLQLSDREKRALAAERRILKSIGKAAENLALVRCYKCAMNITGKVPFEYNNFVFCSMDCLKAHRISHRTNQS